MTLRLLVADESGALQKMVRLAYATEDAEIEAVFSGDAALDILYEFRPDVVLAAVALPGYSGYEVCELIRQDPEFALTPVILLSGAFDPFDDEEAARVEASGHLTKPFDTSEMLDMIERLRPSPVRDRQPSHVGQWGDFEESHELSPAEAEQVGDGFEGGGDGAGIAESAEAVATAQTRNEPLAETPASAPDAARNDSAAGRAEPEEVPGAMHTSAPTAPAAAMTSPTPAGFAFGVSSRAWESFLGAGRILDIFDQPSAPTGEVAETDWRIPDKLVDRVVEEVLARMAPELEALVQKYK
ncbi:MAG: response regulator [Acidobacteriota bacterium]|jgi:CheY-like chemotaxis protein|nr:response regulator [Acidobacteriota bacterium]